MSNLKCFVATAFGHKDVDAIYDNAIRVVLKELEIKPLRVDRVHHNDDIDDKIYELLEQADFCIADLTNARPSVYYEAGYAFGKNKPVIYVVRKDHFYARDDDPAGNLKVHFDLQMKNIIPWTIPISSFKKNLRRRITVAIKPMIRLEKHKALRELEKSEFNSKSQNNQLRAISTKARSLIYSRGFRKVKDREYEGERFKSFCRLKNSIYEHINFVAVPKISKIDLKNYLMLFALRSISRKQEANMKQLNMYLIIASLRSARIASLVESLPFYEQVTDRVFRANVEGFSRIPRNNTVIVIDSISSPSSFVSQLRNKLDNLQPA